MVQINQPIATVITRTREVIESEMRECLEAMSEATSLDVSCQLQQRLDNFKAEWFKASRS